MENKNYTYTLITIYIPMEKFQKIKKPAELKKLIKCFLPEFQETADFIRNKKNRKLLFEDYRKIFVLQEVQMKKIRLYLNKTSQEDLKILDILFELKKEDRIVLFNIFLDKIFNGTKKSKKQKKSDIVPEKKSDKNQQPSNDASSPEFLEDIEQIKSW